MVRASGQERATAAALIVGGFVLVPIPALMVAWRSLSVGDFRTWLACWEIRARRQGLDAGRSPAYSTLELAKLLGISERRTRASVRRLVAAGLIEWGLAGIKFLDPGFIPADADSVSDSITGGQGALMVPRRMLRCLADGARPALIATVLGILLRCLSRRRDGFDGWGRVKASWIAKVFGIDVRTVKAARAELVGMGWITFEESDRQSAMNRWGRACRINLEWAGLSCRQSPPLPVVEVRVITTPSVDLDPLREKFKYQEPASSRPDQTGDWMQEQGGASQSHPPVVSDLTGNRPEAHLADIQTIDLTDTARTLQLHDQAVAKGLVTNSENDRLRFVALAEHARQVGKANPPGLFSALLRRAAWAFITNVEEDAARRKLAAYDRAGRAGQSGQALPSARVSNFKSDDQSFEDRRAEMLRALAVRLQTI